MALDRNSPDENLQYPTGGNNSLLASGDLVAENLRVISFLGSGGMSHVYKCQDLLLSRIIAVKTLRAGFSEESLRRFQTEGRAIARLEHPNIVKLYGLALGADSLPILTMEFVDGISLASLLQKEGALSVSRSLRIALQIAEGLAAAQREGIIHRDLKPANIMIVNAGALDEKVKILDFGIAKIQNEMSVKATQTGDVFGTPQYMSPEQAMGKKCDGRSDQYSFGCVLFEMLCGHPPFQHDSMVSVLIAHAQEQAPSLNKSMKQAPSARLQALVSKLLQKNPADRFESMEAVSQSIFQATTQSGVAPGRMIGIALALALVAIVAGVCVFNIRGSENREILGQSLVSKSSVAEKMPVPVPAIEVSTVAGAPDEVALAASTKPSPADESILAHLDQYMHGPELILEGKELSDAGLAVIARNRNLRIINLRKCHLITAAGVASISSLPLTTLNLEDTDINDDVAQSLSRMSSLQALVLDHTDITTNTCSQIASLPVLQILKLRDTAIDASALPYLSSMKNLRDLDLARTNIAGGLAALNNSSIKYLNLKGVRLIPSDWEEGILLMKNLQVLYLDDSAISNTELQKLSRLKHLSRISLSDCRNLSAENIVEFHKHAPLCLIDQNKVDAGLVLPTVRPSELVGPELIKNGDFEQSKIPDLHQECAFGSTAIADWKIATGSVHWVNKKQRPAGSGVASIELNGSTPGKMSQSISTIPGRKYCLRFKAAASAPAQIFEVRAGQQEILYNISPSNNTGARLNWLDYAWTFTATDKKTLLEFWSCVNGASGPCIDKVSVRLMTGQ
jgi:serine/threonine protein kinase